MGLRDLTPTTCPHSTTSLFSSSLSSMLHPLIRHVPIILAASAPLTNSHHSLIGAAIVAFGRLLDAGALADAGGFHGDADVDAGPGRPAVFVHGFDAAVHFMSDLQAERKLLQHAILNRPRIRHAIDDR